MGLGLRHRRAIGRGLSKIVRKEFKSGLRALASESPTQEDIHEARKSLKKIRAELRLLQEPLGADYTHEDKRLRRVAHLLSSLREADATLETLDALHHRYWRVISDGVAGTLMRTLKRRQHAIHGQARGRVREAVAQLQRASRSVPAEVRSTATRRLIRDGLVRGYQRARAAMRKVSLDSDATEFHLWRRRLKDHWYHVRLFARLQPAAGARATRLKRLERWLGEDHNLSVLREMVAGCPQRFGNARETALILGCITKYQRVLRQRALGLGGRMFAWKPTRFAKTAAVWC